MTSRDAARIMRTVTAIPLMSLKKPETELMFMADIVGMILNYFIREAFFFRFRGFIHVLLKGILIKIWEYFSGTGAVKDTKNMAIVSGTISSIV